MNCRVVVQDISNYVLVLAVQVKIFVISVSQALIFEMHMDTSVSITAVAIFVAPYVLSGIGFFILYVHFI